MAEYVVVGLTIAGALVYAAWRGYRAFREAKNPCYGCSGCPLNEAQRRAKTKNRACIDKK